MWTMNHHKQGALIMTFYTRGFKSHINRFSFRLPLYCSFRDTPLYPSTVFAHLLLSTREISQVVLLCKLSSVLLLVMGKCLYYFKVSSV